MILTLRHKLTPHTLSLTYISLSIFLLSALITENTYALSALSMLSILSLLAPRLYLLSKTRGDKILAWAYKTFSNLKIKTNKPFYLVLGRQFSGKSTLLENSGATLIDSMAFNHKGSIKQDIWTDSKCYMIEKFCNNYTLTNFDLLKQYWSFLHHMIRSHSSSPGISGAIVVVSALSLLRPEEGDSLSQLHQEIRAFKQCFPSADIHLIITHLDKVQGFYDIFQFYEQALYEKPFGILQRRATIASLFSNIYEDVEHLLIQSIEAQRLRHHYAFDQVHTFRAKFQTLKQHAEDILGEHNEKAYQPLFDSLHFCAHSSDKALQQKNLFEMSSESQSLDSGLSNNAYHHYFSKGLVASLVKKTRFVPLYMAKILLLLLLSAGIVTCFLPHLSRYAPLNYGSLPKFLYLFSSNTQPSPHTPTAIHKDTYSFLSKAMSTAEPLQSVSHAATELSFTPKHTPEETTSREKVLLHSSASLQPSTSAQSSAQPTTCGEAIASACSAPSPKCIHDFSVLATGHTARDLKIPEIMRTCGNEHTFSQHSILRKQLTVWMQNKPNMKGLASTLKASFPSPLSTENSASLIAMLKSLCTLMETPQQTECSQKVGAELHALILSDYQTTIQKTLLPKDPQIVPFAKKVSYIAEHIPSIIEGIEHLYPTKTLSMIEDAFALPKQEDFFATASRPHQELAECLRTTSALISKSAKPLLPSTPLPNATTRALSLHLAHASNACVNHPIASSLWNVYQSKLINAVQKDLQSQWQAIVFAPFQTDLKNLYPFSTDTERSGPVEFTKMHRFFAPDSEIQRFFSQTLLSLTDSSEEDGTPKWKTINGKPIFDTELPLDLFMNYQLIQKAYYPKNDQTSPGYNGVLYCTHKSRSIKKVILSLDHIDTEIPEEKHKALSINWPAHKHIAIKVIKTDGTTHVLYQSHHGWGFDQLLSRFSHNSGNQESDIITKVEDLETHLHFESKAFIAPITLGIVRNFDIPATLFPSTSS